MSDDGAPRRCQGASAKLPSNDFGTSMRRRPPAAIGGLRQPKKRPLEGALCGDHPHGRVAWSGGRRVCLGGWAVGRAVGRSGLEDPCVTEVGGAERAGRWALGPLWAYPSPCPMPGSTQRPTRSIHRRHGLCPSSRSRGRATPRRGGRTGRQTKPSAPAVALRRPKPWRSSMPPPEPPMKGNGAWGATQEHRATVTTSTQKSDATHICERGRKAAHLPFGVIGECAGTAKRALHHCSCDSVEATRKRSKRSKRCKSIKRR